VSIPAETESGRALSFFDAHNHLQDERLGAHRADIMAAIRRENVRKMVVNGSCESDWPAVLDLARRYPEVVASFGYHPWYMKERSSSWIQKLESFLDSIPSAVGEIGLDRWIKDFDSPTQEEVFRVQLRLGAERNLPVSIHCLKAWGRLLELLEEGPRPKCGFVLHSFGGPQEMIPALSKLGAYFSLPGYFAHSRKVRQREAFRHVPPDRLLVETDAPDQLLPLDRVRFEIEAAADGKAVNHPANLIAVYQFAAELRDQPLDELARQVEANFQRLFGSVSTS